MPEPGGTTADRILRTSEVIHVTGLSRTSIWRKSRSETDSFPRSVRLTSKSVAFFESEVLEWLRSRPRA